MDYQELFPKAMISELVFQAYRSGILTQENKKQLRNLFLQQILTQEDITAINRLIHAIRRGWLRIANY